MFDLLLFGGRVLFVALLAALLIAMMRTGIGLVSGQREGDREWSLFIDKGPRGVQGLAVPIRGPVVVGRAASSDIVISDRCVSSAHARFAVHDDALTVEDLGSTNGTKVNKEFISAPVNLADGDKVVVGDTVIKVRHA